MHPPAYSCCGASAFGCVAAPSTYRSRAALARAKISSRCSASPRRMVSARSFNSIAEALQHGPQGLAVGDTDVPPHDRVAGGDAGEVPKAAGGVAEDLVVLAHARQGVHQAEGEHVGQVAGGGQDLVVVGDVHEGDLGATGPPHGGHPLDGRGLRLGQGGQDDPSVLVELGKGGLHAAALGPGDGVTRHQPGGICPKAARASATTLPLTLPPSVSDGVRGQGSPGWPRRPLAWPPAGRRRRPDPLRRRPGPGPGSSGPRHPAPGPAPGWRRERPQPTTSPTAPAARRARAREPPMSPTPMTRGARSCPPGLARGRRGSGRSRPAAQWSPAGDWAAHSWPTGRTMHPVPQQGLVDGPAGTAQIDGQEVAHRGDVAEPEAVAGGGELRHALLVERDGGADVLAVSRAARAAAWARLLTLKG